MSTNVDNYRLRALYQYFTPPARSPNELTAVARPSKRILRRTIPISLPQLTTPRPYPSIEGDSRGSSTFRRLAAACPTPTALQWFAAALVLSSLALAVGLGLAGVTIRAPLWMLTILVSGAFLAERQSVHLTANTQVSISGLPIVFAAVVYGPLEAMLVGACAMAGDVGRPHTRWAIWTASRALAGGLAGTAAIAFADELSSLKQVALVVAIAASVDALADGALALATAALRRNGSVRDVMLSLGRLFGATLPLQAIVVSILAYTFLASSPWAALLFLIPALGCQRLLVLYQQQRQLAEDLGTANARLEQANISFASGLVAALDARDRYTAGHSAAVAIYARDVAAHLGLSVAEQRLAHVSGLLHDVGKVGLPHGILEKEGPLTAEERQAMEQHSSIGERILDNVDGYEEVARVVRFHHERVDGAGYPDGLRGEAIPLVAKIIAVADAYNAMTSGRPYRAALPTPVAVERLRESAGSQFEPAIVEAFIEVLQASSHAYRSGARADFAFEAHRYVAGLAA
jgi:putative nucleotidyltransferase with HDIG domain